MGCGGIICGEVEEAERELIGKNISARKWGKIIILLIPVEIEIEINKYLDDDFLENNMEPTDLESDNERGGLLTAPF